MMVHAVSYNVPSVRSVQGNELQLATWLDLRHQKLKYSSLT